MKYWWIRIFDYKTDEELKEYSASCLASGAYMYWEDFKDKRLPAHKAFIFEGGDF